MPTPLDDLTNRKFGHLTVMHRAENDKQGKPQWLCTCTCGVQKAVRAVFLRNGNTISCGCFNRKQTADRLRTHGKSGDSIYRTWDTMVRRCISPAHGQYRFYGARGVTVCDRWRKFENFYQDMGEPPTPSHTIDRVDNSRGYEPGNCRWADMKTQANNKTSNRLLTHNGQTMTVSMWANRLNIGYNTLHERLRKGWSAERALTTPVRNKRPNGAKQTVPSHDLYLD